MHNILSSILNLFISLVKSPQQSWKSALTELAVLISIILILRTFVFSIFVVEGASMCPTFNQFGNHCSSSGQASEFIVGNRMTYLFGNPQRGDVVVFVPPTQDHKMFWEKDFYIKRVIGTPGDRISIENGEIYLSNETENIIDQKIEEPFLSERNKDLTQTFNDQTVFNVPEGHYFVLGDNRDQSLDSRKCFRSFGNCEANDAFVSKHHIKAQASIVIWPMNHWRLVRNEITEQFEKN